MICFSSHLKCFCICLGTLWLDHELLYRKIISCMLSAVQYVHCRNWQCICIRTSEIAVQWHIKRIGCRLCHSHRYAKNGIGAKTCLVVCTIQLDHQIIYLSLASYIHSEDLTCNSPIDVINSFQYTLAIISIFFVTKFKNFVCAGRCTGWYTRSSKSNISVHINFNCRIPSGIQYLPCMYLFDIILVFISNVYHIISPS